MENECVEYFCSVAYFNVLFVLRQRFVCVCVLLKILSFFCVKTGTNVRGSCYGNYLFCHFLMKYNVLSEKMFMIIIKVETFIIFMVLTYRKRFF